MADKHKWDNLMMKRYLAQAQLFAAILAGVVIYYFVTTPGATWKTFYEDKLKREPVTMEDAADGAAFSSFIGGTVNALFNIAKRLAAGDFIGVVQEYWKSFTALVVLYAVSWYRDTALAHNKRQRELHTTLTASLVGPPALGSASDPVDFGVGPSRSRGSDGTAADGDSDAAAEVTDIIVYPIKSCRGISVRRAAIGRCGFVNDRRFMVVNTEKGNLFCSQRTMPKMALVSVFLDPLAGVPDAEVEAAALAVGDQKDNGGNDAESGTDGDAGAEYDAAESSKRLFELASRAAVGTATTAAAGIGESEHGYPKKLAVDRSAQESVKACDSLLITAPKMPHLVVKVKTIADAREQAERYRKRGNRLARGEEPIDLLTVDVWGTKITNAVDQGDAAAVWFESMLGVEGLRLVYMDEEDGEGEERPVRAVAAKAAVNKGVGPGRTDAVSYADGMPYLLASRASLRDLNERLGISAAAATKNNASKGVPMRRFRPNIVVDGAGEGEDGWKDLEPWAEDGWRELSFQDDEEKGNNGKGRGINFFGVKRCSRCKLTTVDPFTAAPADSKAEPLRTLREFRKIEEGEGKGSLLFGENLVAEYRGKGKGTAVLAVGSKVTIKRAEEKGKLKLW